MIPVPLFTEKSNYIDRSDYKHIRSALKAITGLRPRKLMLYRVALTHRSSSLCMPDGSRLNNERLEFLGDAVLNAILSDHLFALMPGAGEGRLTKTRSKLVNRDILNHAALKMGIDRLLVSQAANGTNSRHLYGDALEALTGAIFIDKGYKKTRKFVVGKLLGLYVDTKKILETENDYKSLLFEWAQKNKADLQTQFSDDYDTSLKQSVFTAVISINQIKTGKGRGVTKKEAEQEASQKAWLTIISSHKSDRKNNSHEQQG